MSASSHLCERAFITHLIQLLQKRQKTGSDSTAIHPSLTHLFPAIVKDVPLAPQQITYRHGFINIALSSHQSTIAAMFFFSAGYCSSLPDDLSTIFLTAHERGQMVCLIWKSIPTGHAALRKMNRYSFL